MATVILRTPMALHTVPGPLPQPAPSLPHPRSHQQSASLPHARTLVSRKGLLASATVRGQPLASVASRAQPWVGRRCPSQGLQQESPSQHGDSRMEHGRREPAQLLRWPALRWGRWSDCLCLSSGPVGTSGLTGRGVPVVRAVGSGAVEEVGTTAGEEGGGAKATIYRPVVILPGLGNNSADYAPLVRALEARGLSCVVAQVSRPDWLRNALGLLDGAYWRGTLKPRPVLDWYLKRIADAIQKAKEGVPEGTKVSFIGHSAGGWLARVYFSEFGSSDVQLLLTLGAPHQPPPRGVAGVVDQTRGLLYWVEENCKAAGEDAGVKYVCVAGRYIKGAHLFGSGDSSLENVADAAIGIEAMVAEGGIGEGAAVGAGAVGPWASSKEEATATWRQKLIGQGYKQVCGKADVWGDGVVPEESALLPGAINITLDGIYHSPVGATDAVDPQVDGQDGAAVQPESNDGAAKGRPWYGSQGIIDSWIGYLLE